MKKMLIMAMVVIATSAAAKSSAAWPAWPVENIYLATFPKYFVEPGKTFPMEPTFPMGKTFPMG